MAALLIGNKRKAPVLEEGEAENPQYITNGKRVAVIANPDAEGKRGIEETPEFIRPAVISPAVSTSQVRLAVPKVRSIVNRVIDAAGYPSSNVPSAAGGNSSTSGQGSTLSAEDTIFEARNARTLTDKEPTRLTLTRHGQIIWMDFLPKAALLVTGNNNFWCAACEDGSIYVFSPVGRRVLNPLVIESQPCFLDCRGWWLMCISSVGVGHVWLVHLPLTRSVVLTFSKLGTLKP